jgi:hypothetical protein
LPSGLKIVNKLGFLDNRYELLNLEQIEVQKSFMDLRDCCQDNMLTLMKSEEGIELAICVCMYNEDKIMLKSTLAGVTENISNLVSREKISSDKIGVFFLMDGIEKGLISRRLLRRTRTHEQHQIRGHRFINFFQENIKIDTVND